MIKSGRRDPRNLVCLARLERAPDALSTRSLCQLGYRHIKEGEELETNILLVLLRKYANY